MKCDELQYERLGDANETYPASTLVIRKQFVDSAIDELKREHHKERDEYIDWVNRLQKEYAELKEVYKESVDVKVKIWERCKKAEDEIRMQKRALWLARAWGANQRTKYLDFFLTGRAHAIRKYKWIKITSKCRAKAEEYK